MRLGASSLLPTLAQMALGTAASVAGSRALTGGLKKLGVLVVGLAAAALMAVMSAVTLMVALVLWVMPPGTSPALIFVIVGALLGALALVLWQVFSRGHTPTELVDEAFAEPSPVEAVTAGFHHLIQAFERGWNTPEPTPTTNKRDWQ
ncbi:MAG: hypothetical protein GC129_06020 [Proteobacteria bacterium]|nr:hypothetical protein [Pseudomonadota bacterium]